MRGVESRFPVDIGILAAGKKAGFVSAGRAVSMQRAINHGKSILFDDKTILCFLRGGLRNKQRR